VERYPRLQKVQRMLVVLDQALRQAEQGGSPGITAMIVREGPDVGVHLLVWLDTEATERRINLAKELGLSGGETVGLFRWAEAAGFIRPNYGDGGPNVNIPTPSLEYLQPEGYELIGELPDPQERLALILEAAIRAVQRDDSLDEAAKKRRVDWFEELKIVVRTFGIEGAKAVLRGDIPPM
jgi:hypothetical protein